MPEMHAIPELDEPEPALLDDDESEEQMRLDVGFVAEPPHPVNWNLLTADEARDEWGELDKWVTWLRHTYGLPSSVIPPFWHRHAELVWELSALHLHWLCAYDPGRTDRRRPAGTETSQRPVSVCVTGSPRAVPVLTETGPPGRRHGRAKSPPIPSRTS